MVKWITQVEIMRTTANGGDGWCGVVTGIGATPELALAELRREGEELGRRLLQKVAEANEAAEAAEAAKAYEEAKRDIAAYEDRRRIMLEEEHMHPVPYHAQQALRAREATRRHRRQPRYAGTRLCRFEVVDIRLTPAPEEGGRGGWLAYGTLAWVGEPRTDREDRRQGEQQTE